VLKESSIKAFVGYMLSFGKGCGSAHQRSGSRTSSSNRKRIGPYFPSRNPRQFLSGTW